MARIEKKLWPKYFDAVASGKKNFEIRVNDFEVAEGDTLVLREFDPETKSYTGRDLEKCVTYVTHFSIDDLKSIAGSSGENVIEEKGIQVIALA